jgi:hypothetical protein
MSLGFLFRGGTNTLFIDQIQANRLMRGGEARLERAASSAEEREDCGE